MDPLATRVPDAIEPLSAYRAWFYSIEGRTARLYPVSGQTGPSGRSAWDGAGASWVTASCSISGSPTHAVPSEGCSCGFYSVKAFELAVSHATNLHLMAGTRGRGGELLQVVLGRILLSGKVIEHDLGYRAERARIAELIPLRGTERSVMVLAHRLRVGMAPAVEPRQEAVIEAVVLPGPPPTRTAASGDFRSSAVAGFAAIAVLTVALVLLSVGVWRQPPIPLLFLSLSQIGRSAGSMRQALKKPPHRPSRGTRRPKLVPPLPSG